MNKLLLQKDFGLASNVLELVHRPLPLLGDHKIRIKMQMANINPSDLLSIQGVGQYKVNHKPPRVPGFEGVGHVIESNNPGITIGQKVVVAHSGTWQQYVDITIDDVFVIPENIDNSYAAQLYINSLTAWVILTQILRVNTASVVMINAGCSAIGKLFSQLSQSLGYTLIAVTSNPQDCTYGAQYVIDSNTDIMQQLIDLAAPKPNVILDAIGGKKGGELLRHAAEHAQFIVYGSLSLQPYTKGFYELSEQKLVSSQYFFLRNWEDSVGKAQRRAEFDTMLNHFTNNDISLDVESTIPVEHFQKAIRLLTAQQGQLKGKVLLTF